MLQGRTVAEALELLKQHIDKEGSQTKFARKYGLNNTDVSLTMNGLRAMPPSIAGALGLQKQVLYVEPDKPKKGRR